MFIFNPVTDTYTNINNTRKHKINHPQIHFINSKYIVLMYKAYKFLYVLIQLVSVMEIYVSSNICVSNPVDYSNKNNLKLAKILEPERELNEQ